MGEVQEYLRKYGGMESMDGLLGILEMVDYKLVGKCMRAERYCNVRVTYNNYILAACDWSPRDSACVSRLTRLVQSSWLIPARFGRKWAELPPPLASGTV